MTIVMHICDGQHIFKAVISHILTALAQTLRHINKRITMNTRFLAAGLIVLVGFALPVQAAKPHKIHPQLKAAQSVQRIRIGRWTGPDSDPGACLVFNGIEVTSKSAIGCPATGMPYADAYAPNGFDSDGFGSNWGE